MIVIDTSAAAPFVLPDEAGNRLAEITEGLVLGLCTAPGLFAWELANIIWKTLRSGRMTAGEQSEAVLNAEALSIALDLDSTSAAFGETLRLANLHDLTVYDAAYLELAIRQKAALASFDKALRAAAITEELQVYPTP